MLVLLLKVEGFILFFLVCCYIKPILGDGLSVTDARPCMSTGVPTSPACNPATASHSVQAYNASTSSLHALLVEDANFHELCLSDEVDGSAIAQVDKLNGGRTLRESKKLKCKRPDIVSVKSKDTKSQHIVLNQNEKQTCGSQIATRSLAKRLSIGEEKRLDTVPVVKPPSISVRHLRSCDSVGQSKCCTESKASSATGCSGKQVYKDAIKGKRFAGLKKQIVGRYDPTLLIKTCSCCRLAWLVCGVCMFLF